MNVIQSSVHITRTLDLVETGICLVLCIFVHVFLGILTCMLGSEVREKEWIWGGRCPEPVGSMCPGVWELLSSCGTPRKESVCL